MELADEIWRRRLAGWVGQTDRAYLLALRTTGAPDLAEEAVQQVYTRLLLRPPEDRGEEAAMAYFLKAVHGAAVDLTRSTSRRRG